MTLQKNAKFTEPNTRNIQPGDYVCVRTGYDQNESLEDNAKKVHWGTVTRVFHAPSGALRIVVAGLDSKLNREWCFQDQIVSIDQPGETAAEVAASVPLDFANLSAARLRANAQAYRCFVNPQGVNAVDEKIYKVKSQSGGVYAVFISDEGGRCSCLDFMNRKRVCKHIVRVVDFNFQFSYAEAA